MRACGYKAATGGMIGIATAARSARASHLDQTLPSPIGDLALMVRDEGRDLALRTCDRGVAAMPDICHRFEVSNVCISANRPHRPGDAMVERATARFGAKIEIGIRNPGACGFLSARSIIGREGGETTEGRQQDGTEHREILSNMRPRHLSVSDRGNLSDRA
jgi:hypothetical protein